MTEEEQLVRVRQNVYRIEFIKNPSEEVQLAAVTEIGNAIRYIKNPSEEVQLAAVSRKGQVIKYITAPSEAVQLADITPIDSLRHSVRFTLKNLAATDNHCKCPRCRNYTQSSMINLDNLCDRCESELDFWKKNS